MAVTSKRDIRPRLNTASFPDIVSYFVWHISRVPLTLSGVCSTNYINIESCRCLAHLYVKFRSVFLSFSWTNKVFMYVFLVFKNYLHISSSLAISN